MSNKITIVYIIYCVGSRARFPRSCSLGGSNHCLGILGGQTPHTLLRSVRLSPMHIAHLAALVASFLGAATATAETAAAATTATPPPATAAFAPLLGAGRSVQQPARFRATASSASKYGVQDGSAGAISQTKGGEVGPDLTACAPGCDWPNSYKCCGGKCVDMEMPCE